MNVFVLGTGRCGSTTFFRACQHLTNFTTAHEGRAKRYVGRLNYPDRHIEVDPWLVDHLGGLKSSYPDARYVYLSRPEDEIVDSLLKRWGKSAWLRYLDGLYNPETDDERRQVCAMCVRRMTDNLRLFLGSLGADQVVEIPLHDAKRCFPSFLTWIGAEGDLAAAVAEWDKVHTPCQQVVQVAQAL